MKELIMKRLCSLICLLILLAISGNSGLYAQYKNLDEALSYVPFSDFPYRERFNPEGRMYGY